MNGGGLLLSSVHDVSAVHAQCSYLAVWETRHPLLVSPMAQSIQIFTCLHSKMVANVVVLYVSILQGIVQQGVLS